MFAAALRPALASAGALGLTFAACTLTTSVDGLSGGGAASSGSTPSSSGAPGTSSSSTASSGTGGSTSGASGRDGAVAADGGACTIKSTGPRSGTVATSSGPGAAWQSPNSALALDGAGARVAAPDESQRLRVSGFGLAIRGAAEIRGVTVTLVARAAAGSDVRDEVVKLVVSGGESTSRDTNEELPAAYAAVEYGGDEDRWGLPLTPAVVGAAAFGVDLQLKNHGSDAAAAEVDAIRVEVFYCE